MATALRTEERALHLEFGPLPNLHYRELPLGNTEPLGMLGMTKRTKSQQQQNNSSNPEITTTTKKMKVQTFLLNLL